MSTWSLFIKDDIKERIGTGEPLPCKLTLQSLAKHYKVSLTPVRQAAAKLIEEGYLHKQSNARLSINNKKTGSWRKSAVRRRAAPPKDHFEEIRENVILVCLKGEPVFLREEDTAARYGISGTTIRQIFSRLAGSGIIEHVPRRGWRVRPFRNQQLEEFTQVRKVLELEAMRLAWPKLLDADLQEIRNGNVLPKTSKDEAKVNDDIHGYLIEQADNQHICDFMDRHMRFFSVLFTWEGSDRQAAIETVHQHWAVLDALLERDRRAAKKALLEHLDYGHSLLRSSSLNRFDNAKLA